MSCRIAIDCISPARLQQIRDIDQQSAGSKFGHSRSQLRWFGAGSATSTADTNSSRNRSKCSSKPESIGKDSLLGQVVVGQRVQSYCDISADTANRLTCNASASANANTNTNTNTTTNTTTTSNNNNTGTIREPQPISGFWAHLSSLIEQSHDKDGGNKLNHNQLLHRDAAKTTMAPSERHPPEELTQEAGRADEEAENKKAAVSKSPRAEPKSLNIYSSVQRRGHSQKAVACRQAKIESDEQQDDGKCQSLNLYQNLLRNYVHRRNINNDNNTRNSSSSHHHIHAHDQGHSCGSRKSTSRQHHYHHHHHHHRSHRHNSKRHTTTNNHSTTTRCGCSHSCAASSSLEKNCCLLADNDNCYSCENGNKPAVWGQLIKISKSDGSQVIELQRAAGKSWGFFVARGAINNSKGIFISRIHDDVASSSLAGLLGIGDRILAIDECPIEPDKDILQVNQMISKKSKMFLRVKPFMMAKIGWPLWFANNVLARRWPDT